MADRPRTTPEAALLPARRVDLRRAVRVGLQGGLAGVFLSAVGMVAAFKGRPLVGDLSLGYAVVAAMPLAFAYFAGRPPPQLEGYAAARRGPRNLLAGLGAGAAGGLVLAAFVVLIDAVNLRRVFINLSPELVDLLTFGKGTAAGSGLILLAAAALGLGGGGLHLLADRWRRPAVAAVMWVLLFGLMESLISGIFRGAGIPGLAGLLYEPGGALGLPGAVFIGAVSFALHAVVGRGRRPLRTALERMPARRKRLFTVGLGALALVVLVVLPQVLGPFLTEVLDVAGIFLLMALGLNIVVGFAGLLDLGYVAFFAVGAYTTAVLTSPASPGFSPELTFWAALPFVLMAAAASGIVVGTPVLRMRGDYLAIVTLGFGEIARILFLSDALKGNFGGAQGIIGIPDIVIGPVVVHGPQAFFYAIFAFVLIAAYISYALQDSRMGRAWMAMREDESVAEAMGVNIVATKLWAFIIGAVLASFGGALFAVKIGSVFPHSFNIIVSITVLVVIIVGGLGSMPGVLLGALVLVGLPELLREFEEFKFLIYGVLLIFMMLRRPEGFVPSKRRARELGREEELQDAWGREQAVREAGVGPAPAG